MMDKVERREILVADAPNRWAVLRVASPVAERRTRYRPSQARQRIRSGGVEVAKDGSGECATGGQLSTEAGRARARALSVSRLGVATSRTNVCYPRQVYRLLLEPGSDNRDGAWESEERHTQSGRDKRGMRDMREQQEEGKRHQRATSNPSFLPRRRLILSTSNH